VVARPSWLAGAVSLATLSCSSSDTTIGAGLFLLGALAGAAVPALMLSKAHRRLRQVDGRTVELEQSLERRDRELKQQYADLEAARERLRSLAATDALTGVYNRAYFDQHLPREWKRAERAGASLALVRVRIDQIEEIGEQHGRRTVDRCLDAVAGALDRVSKRAEDYVVRLEAEEFAVVLPQADERGARRLAERVEGRLAALDFVDEGTWIPLTAGIGIACATPGPGATSEALIAAAGEAAELATSRGHGEVVLASSLQATSEADSQRAGADRETEPREDDHA
jgi:diguanylate cyclase